MKQFDLFKKLFLVCILCAAGAANAQVHTLAYGYVPLASGAITTNSNWYADYVGLRLEVITPASDAGDKVYTTANDGNPSNTSDWGGYPSAPIINDTLIMPQAGDSMCGIGGTITAITVNMTGKVALVYRGGSIYFGDKAYQAQLAGAVACIIVNNIPGGPVGMAVGGSGSSVTIPTFMISQADGDVLDGLINSGIKPTVTITTWGQNLQNDLGFIPNGIAGWHCYAIPQNQMASGGNAAAAYIGMDGAFVGNFGSHTATNVKVTSTLNFTPTGGSSSVIHTDHSGTLGTFLSTDSVYSFYAPASYSIPAQTTTGEYDLTYTITQDSIDQSPGDNTATYSFFTTDSVFSKGRYDFTGTDQADGQPQPLRTLYEAFNGDNEYIWGPMYYVANAGSSVSKVQYSLALNVASGGSPVLIGQNSVYLFQWIDGRTDSVSGVQYPLDSIVEDGELELVSLGIKNYNGTTDTSEALLNLTNMGDSTGNPAQVVLNANSWYYLAVDVPSSTTTPMFIGTDGILDPFPRIYGIFNNDGVLDYSNLIFGGAEDSLYINYQDGNLPCPDAQVSYIKSVDSFNYGAIKGLVPSVSMVVKPTTVGVKTIGKPIADVNLYPNPAKDYINVSISLDQPAKTVTYELIDGLARFVSKESHNNVQNEVNTISTRNLAPGNYYLIITVDDKIMSKKFTVIK